jgi:flagellar biosynthesis/type III secretory pathway M-ring protein FliF/YscJ
MVEANEQENIQEEFENNLDTNNTNFFTKNRLLIVIVAGVIIVLIILITIGFFVRKNMNKPNEEEKNTQISTLSNKKYKYETAFEGLTPMDAAQIRKALSYENIPFQSIRNGRVIDINVPKEYADYVKLKMAELGLPEGGIVGFEIFDDAAGLGATDYDRRIKYIRAISGELSRIISTMENINSARVQIVMPEKTLFGEKVPGSASVIVNIIDNKNITNEQIRGIMHLIASSVENILPENVAVIDNKGTILNKELKKDAIEQNLTNFIEMLRVSKPEEASPLELLLRFKWDLKNNYEKIFTEKVKKVLETLYPPNSYVVYSNVSLTESYKESTPFEINKINIAIVLDNTNQNLNFSQDLKQSTFQLVSSVSDYVKGRDSIVIELMPFVNIEATKDLKQEKNMNVIEKESLDTLEENFIKKTKSINFQVVIILLAFSTLFFIIAIIIFKRSSSKEHGDNNNISDTVTDENLTEDDNNIDFALEKFRTFVNNNEDIIVKKITKWLSNEDV